MADTKISAETLLSYVSGNERIPCAEPDGSGGWLNRTFTGEMLLGLIQPPFVASRWYAPIHGTLNQSVLTVDTISLIPFILPRPMTVSDLGCRVTTGVAGNLQLALYPANATTSLPTGLALAATGNIDTTAAGEKSADITGSNVALTPGLLWMAVNSDATATVQTLGSSTLHTAKLIGSTTLANLTSGTTAALGRLTFAQTFNTWPDLTGQTFGEASGGGSIVYLKAA